jgi:ABC transporter, permease/ATP-binding protein
MGGIRTIRATNATDSEASMLESRVEDAWQAGLKMAKVQSIVSPIANIGFQLSAIVVILVGAYRTSIGAMSISELVQFAALLFILVSPLGQMASALSQLHSSLGSLQRINEILDLPREDELDMANLLSPELLKTLQASAKPNAPAIDFDDVVFTYGTREFGQEMDDADSLVLHKLNLQVPEGKRVAIVGPSGAGKSTVLQLIERFYDVNRGAIRVFGKDIRDYSRSDLRNVLGYVEQDAPVLSGSLRENLTLGLGDVGDDRCMEALERVNLGYLATRSEQGLDGPVGESGASLSGGERQRLAIARALLSNKRILLFDEATANLDSHNERQIGDVLRNMAGNRTVLVVAHRLSTIMDADLIHVLEHGRLVASGTHSELVVKSQIYRNLASEQHLV